MHAELILRWNGRAWTNVAAPRFGDSDVLTAVGASSASDIWAVGDYTTADLVLLLAVHCC